MPVCVYWTTAVSPASGSVWGAVAPVAVAPVMGPPGAGVVDAAPSSGTATWFGSSVT